MSKAERDPEQLLAEALRAQAAQAPVKPEPAAKPAQPVEQQEPGQQESSVDEPAGQGSAEQDARQQDAKAEQQDRHAGDDEDAATEAEAATEQEPDPATGAGTTAANDSRETPAEIGAVDTETPPESGTPDEPVRGVVPHDSGVGYGLLSGADASTVAQVSAELEAQESAGAPGTKAPGVPVPAAPGRAHAGRGEQREPVRRQLGAGWVLLLALLLGLAAGAIIGLATLI